MEINIIIGCEESQVVAMAFRARGFNAYSCDLLPCSGNQPEFHLQMDIFKAMQGGKLVTQAGTEINIIKWHFACYHPECTYLTVTANKWMKPEFAERFPGRAEKRNKAIVFFLKCYYAPVDCVAVENPVGIMSSCFQKPDQYVHPYMFGDPHSKKTGLWLRGLPNLVPTDIVEPEMYTYADGRKDPIWHVESMGMEPEERRKYRSRTFPGFANQMAAQWGDYLIQKYADE